MFYVFTCLTKKMVLEQMKHQKLKLFLAQKSLWGYLITVYYIFNRYLCSTHNTGVSGEPLSTLEC